MKIIKNCEICNTQYEAKMSKSKYCSPKCKNKSDREKLKNRLNSPEAIEKHNKKYDGLAEGYDYLTCPECNKRLEEFGINHVKMHGYKTLKEFLNKYGFEKSKCRKRCDSVKGDKNPGYQHGGKFSPFSDKSEYHTKEQIEEAKKKAADRIRENPTNRLENWIEKFDGDVDKAKEAYHWRQSNGLKKMIHLYGEEEGTRRHADRNERWLNNFPRLNYSKISQELFWEIYNQLPKSTYRFATFDNGIRTTDDSINLELTLNVGRKKAFVPDFIDTETNKIVEFDGWYWHTQCPTRDPEQDKLRDELLINNGYQILRIAECDYLGDKQGIIKQCLQFLTS